MFSKIKKFFEVKPDDTLDYMDPDKLLKNKKRVLKDPLNQADEDEFFRQMEEEEQFIDHLNAQEASKTTPQNNASRESVLKKMRHCMQERDWNPKHHPKIMIALATLVLGIVILAIILHETPNPLIGKWRPQGKNIFLPVGDIEFVKDKFQALGISTMVKYDIDETKIQVIDVATDTGIIFYITGDKTIEVNLLGVKTSYKKMEK